MKALTKVISKINTMIQNHQKARVLLVFRDMSDRQLDDIGISRELLNKGVKAYPWHAPKDGRGHYQVKKADVVSFPAQQPTITIAPRLAA